MQDDINLNDALTEVFGTPKELAPGIVAYSNRPQWTAELNAEYNGYTFQNIEGEILERAGFTHQGFTTDESTKKEIVRDYNQAGFACVVFLQTDSGKLHYFTKQ